MGIGRMNGILGQLQRIAPQAGEEPDHDLLRRYAVGRDQHAFEELVRRHGPMVLGVCRRVAGNEHDAEDAFQATFLVLARRSGHLTSRRPLANWLYGVARRTAQAARRAVARRRAKEAQTRPPSPVDWEERTVISAAVDQEVAGLPGRYRAVLVLADLEGRSRREVAVELGLPEGTVASRLARAREMLATRLARQGWVGPAGSIAIVAPSMVSPPMARAAIELATGGCAGVPVPASALAREVLRAMWWTKLTVRFALAATSALVVVGGLALRPVPGPLLQAGAGEARTAPKPRPEGDEKGLQETILGLEKQGWESLKGKDRGPGTPSLPDDFVAVLADGERLNRAEFLKAMADLAVTDYSISDVTLTRLTPDAAVLTYTVKTTYTYKGEATKETVRASSAWARRGGGWVNAYYHETRIKR